MRILYSPQRSDDTINYQFNGESVTANLNGESDTFDFSAMPDGVAEDIETSLSINPILSAKREGGVLSIELLHFHSANATQEELFPQWQEVL